MYFEIRNIYITYYIVSYGGIVYIHTWLGLHVISKFYDLIHTIGMFEIVTLFYPSITLLMHKHMDCFLPQW